MSQHSQASSVRIDVQQQKQGQEDVWRRVNVEIGSSLSNLHTSIKRAFGIAQETVVNTYYLKGAVE